MTQIGRLEPVPDTIADMVRVSLCHAFLQDGLRWRRRAVDAELHQLRQPAPYVAVKDLLLALPKVDVAFGCLLSGLVLIVPSHDTLTELALFLIGSVPQSGGIEGVVVNLSDGARAGR
jgi:hypothetical protein